MENFLVSFENIIINYSFWGLPASFLGGILASLSPCILPLLPITLTVIGTAAISSKTKSFLISLIFVFGVTTTYVILGIIAAMLGIFLGKIINSFFVYLILGVVFIFLGISFFDIFHFSIFNIHYKPKTNLFSVFILGILSGFTMIPCTFPVLGAILSLISIRKNVFYGVGCLGAFSLGYGLVLVLIGTSGSLMRKLSENKIWFIIIKKVLGLILILIGLYFMAKLFKIL